MTQPTCGQSGTLPLLDLSWYINNVYRPGHFVTQKQSDSTYHIYRNVHIGHIPEIQYNLDRKCFEPRDVHINLKPFKQVFLNTFAEDLENPEHESLEEKESFFTLPESQPETPRLPIRELPSEESIPQHRALKPTKSVLKVRIAQ